MTQAEKVEMAKRNPDYAYCKFIVTIKLDEIFSAYVEEYPLPEAPTSKDRMAADSAALIRMIREKLV
jgi:hypothetical protein